GAQSIGAAMRAPPPHEWPDFARAHRLVFRPFRATDIVLPQSQGPSGRPDVPLPQFLEHAVEFHCCRRQLTRRSGSGWAANPPGAFAEATPGLKPVAVTRAAYTPENHTLQEAS